MPGPGAEARVRQLPRIAVIDLSGYIDAQADWPLHQAYDEAVGAGPDAVLLNFGAVDFINSTGIALIVQLVGQERRAGRRLLACSLNEHFARVLRITRLTDFINLFADEQSALAAIAAS
jgi:anti-sigma B factor antagonist